MIRNRLLHINRSRYWFPRHRNSLLLAGEVCIRPCSTSVVRGRELVKVLGGVRIKRIGHIHGPEAVAPYAISAQRHKVSSSSVPRDSDAYGPARIDFVLKSLEADGPSVARSL